MGQMNAIERLTI